MNASTEIPRTFEEARTSLSARPVGLTPFQIRAQRLALDGASDGIDAAAPIAGDYYVGAYLDLPTADVPVSARMLEDWGLTLDAVLDVAADNHSSEEANVAQFESALIIEGVHFAAAALRSPRAVSGFRPDATPVMVIPEPGIVLLGFAEDADSISSLVTVAQRFVSESGRAVSISPLVKQGEAWAEYPWPASVSGGVAELARRWDRAQYTAARPVLQRTYQNAGQDVFVADLVLAESPQGGLTTYATVMDVRMVVPRADLLVLQSDDGQIKPVPFDEVAAVPGVLESARGTVPAYFAVSRFPAELV